MTSTSLISTSNRFSRTVICIATALYVVFVCRISHVEDLTYISIAVVNAIICSWHMFSTRVGEYTLSKFINLFILVFFVMANAIQYGEDTLTLTFVLTFTEEDYQSFQLTTFIILIIYNTLYYHWASPRSRSKLFINNSAQPNVSSSRLILISLISSLAVFVFFNFNPYLLFYRVYLDEYLGLTYDSDAMSYLIFDKLIRPIPISCYIISLLTKTAPRGRLILFILALATEFPLGVARNAAAMYWLPVILIVLERFLRGNRVMWMMIAGLFLVFPALDMVRYKNPVNQNIETGIAYLNTMNYDASQLFMATMKTETITYGNQLSGALLFFVPRSVWPEKPKGSGHFLTEKYNGVFNNVSMPFFAEGYINFGWFGIIGFTVFIALLTSKIDQSFWNAKRRKSKSYKLGYYLFLLGAIIFIMRGDLLSSTAYFVGTMGGYFITFTLVKIPQIRKR